MINYFTPINQASSGKATMPSHSMLHQIKQSSSSRCLPRQQQWGLERAVKASYLHLYINAQIMALRSSYLSVSPGSDIPPDGLHQMC